MKHCDVLIVGAGLLGCFAARSLSAYALDTVVLEAREDVCTGISRANTGIIYAGYDTKPHTLKTDLCVRANRGFDALCAELDVPFSRCGSLMIACGGRAEEVLRRKYRDGLENGVDGLELLCGEEVRALEPNLTKDVSLGLLAPGSGTVDPWALGIAAYENALANGAEFRFNEAVEQMERTEGGFLVHTAKESYFAKAVWNCAGLCADRVRELCETPSVRIFPSAADYLVLDTGAQNFLKHIIFHEPEEKGKGLTLVPTVDGNLLIGPTERDRSGAPDDATAEEGLEFLRTLCGKIVPDLDLSQVIRNFGATRPNPYYVNFESGRFVPEKRSISSFTVLEETGLFSLIGIKTPGLTCAAALGDYVAEKVLAHLGGAVKKADFDPRRRSIPCPRTMTEARRAELIGAAPAFGRILCRCRGVSEGEILEAIARGATTVDAVKRRVGAGMGRCQGGYCMQRVMELLAQAQGKDISRITKNGAGTEILR